VFYFLLFSAGIQDTSQQSSHFVLHDSSQGASRGLATEMPILPLMLFGETCTWHTTGVVHVGDSSSKVLMQT